MSKTAEKDPITSSLPSVQVGDHVYWYPGGQTSEEPYAAVVTAVGLGGQTLNLNLFDPLSYNLRIRDGVRHVSDPRCREVEFREQGCWDLTPREKEYRALKRQVQELLHRSLGGNHNGNNQEKKS